ncbi:MAG TPA: SDR family oxidoreductase [Terriglobales bacterium]|nr:SDR family oxidoreductase [Terriglobales bacterium]
MLLQNKVALVSGIGPGMGRDIALAFARHGADVVLAARSQASLVEVAEEVRQLGRTALAVPTDIADNDQCRRLVAAAIAELGGVDVLINNAFAGGLEPDFERADLARWREVFGVNVFGSLQLTQLVVPLMKERGGGSIVFINSMSMRIVEAGMGGYAASKGALMTAAQTLARELGRHRIRVNSVVPGYIWSEKLAGYFRYLAKQQQRSYEEVLAEITSRTALQHIPHSAEIADAVLFFASDLSRAVTGQALDVNGGHYFH